MDKTIPLSKIEVKFGGKYPLKDEKLMGLLKKAYKGELLVRTALIKIDGIKPFTDFKPEISNEFREYFEKCEKQRTPLPLYVYPENEMFVMSDDFNSYYSYLEKGYTKVMCILLGDSNSIFIIDKGEAFQLPLPTVTVLES